MGHTTIRTRRPVRTATVVAAALAGTVALAGCGGDDPADPVAVARTGDESAAPAYGLVTPQQAAELATGGVTVIDVRTPEEFAEGHIEGAQLVDFSGSTFADQIAELDPAGEYLVYCRSGNRSAQAVSLMQELGVSQVWELDGGVVAYSAAGLPLVR